MSERIEAMEAFARQFPDNPFPRYALALEYRNAGREQEALAAFEGLSRELPAYVPTYLQFGMYLAELGRAAEARAVFEQGLARAREAKDLHAAGEIERELSRLD